MVEENDYVAIFHNIHRVMKAEKLLKEARLAILLIPVPRQLSSDCGLALRFSETQRAAVLELLQREGLSPAELHQRRAKGYEQLEP